MLTKDQEKAQLMFNKLNVVWEEINETSSLIMELDDEDGIEAELKEGLINSINSHLEDLSRILETAGATDLEDKYLKPACNEAISELKKLVDEDHFDTVEEVKAYLDDAGLRIGYYQECLKQDFELEESEED